MKNGLFSIGLGLALLVGISSAEAALVNVLNNEVKSPNYIVKVEGSSEVCTAEKCRNLSSVRAYNKKYCKSQEECLVWLEQNKICDAEALKRCSEREQLGAEKVPDVRTDGMDF